MRRPLLSRTLLTLTAAAAAVVTTSTVAPVAEEPAPASPAALAHGVTDSAPATTGTTLPVAGKQYAFASVVGGKPVRWNPCAPIHWRANVTRAPLGGLQVLKEAVARVAATTGTTWVFDGTSTAIPSTGALPTTPTQTRPVLIGWTDGATSNLLRGQPAGVVGMTRTSWFGTTSPAGTVAATRGAVIALDRTDRLPLRGPGSWSAVALHELGHAMGLAHPASSTELMAARMPRTASSFQRGDQTGLGLLGRAQGCVNVPGMPG